MKTPHMEISENSMSLYTRLGIDQFDRYEVEDLVEACEYRLVEIMAERLRSIGFSCRTEFYETKMRYILVYPPNGLQADGQFATVQEGQRLIDTAKNLPLAQAFLRWVEKIEPFEEEEYTRADALRDMAAEREQARRDYAAGLIDGEGSRLAQQSALEYLSYIGSKTSERKAASSRKNGLLGGRPRKAK